MLSITFFSRIIVYPFRIAMFRLMGEAKGVEQAKASWEWKQSVLLELRGNIWEGSFGEQSHDARQGEVSCSRHCLSVLDEFGLYGLECLRPGASLDSRLRLGKPRGLLILVEALCIGASRTLCVVLLVNEFICASAQFSVILRRKGWLDWNDVGSGSFS